MMPTHRDPLIADARLAAIVFAVGLAGLLIGATLGLNNWPGQAFAIAAGRATVKDFFFAFHGYTIVLSVLFWGSKPSLRAQRAVIAGWVLTTAALWALLHESVAMSWSDPAGFPMPMFLATSLSLPCVIAMLWRALGPWRSNNAFEVRLRWLMLLAVLFMLVPQAALSLTATLHPHTLDLLALRFDHLAGLTFGPTFLALADRIPAMRQVLDMAYGLTPLGFLAVALVQLRGRPQHVASALLVWVGMTICAMLAYHFFPITGPKYVFGADHYAAALRDAANQPLDYVLVRNYPRNGMPSMHFGWMLAAAILWWQSRTGALSRALITTVAALTAVATLYNGEHYAIDLVVAVPFVLASIALCSTSVPWRSRAKRGTVLLGLACWLTWVLLLRHQMPAFIERPWLCQLLLLATAGVVLAQVRWMRRFARDIRELGQPMPAVALPRNQQQLQWRFGLMFFVSGAAALVYQVLFAKELALVFGSTATATFTVLATFLGGMAIGSLIGGELAHRVKRPLVVYAFVEVGIALYCMVTPQLFEGIQALYVYLAQGTAADASSSLILRVALGAAVLLVPTALMGTTLPLLAQALGPSGGRLGSRVAWLYFANTAGAAFGALLTAYAVIPALGAQRTTFVAALLNLLVALGALELAKQAFAASAPSAPVPDNATTREWSRTARMAALAALGVGGVLSLGLEVVYVHMLSIVAGNSVYAFGLMVATFLLGLSLGGEAARRLLARPQLDTALALVLSIIGLSLAVALGATMWNAIPEYFASYAKYPLARSFGAREAIRGMVCALVMVPPTVFIGASYVFAMDIATATSSAPKSRLLGIGAAVNTAGNITGVLLFGFVLLPALGGLGASQLIASAAVLLALFVLVTAARTQLWRGALACSVALAAVIASTSVKLDYAALSSGANVYFYAQRWGEVIDHAESIDGGLTTVTRSEHKDIGPVHTLLTNGKFQGNDALGGEMQAQIGFALAPLLHQDRRGAALVIGYGTGVTSRVFHEAGFASLDIAELSGDIVRMADHHFGQINQRVSQLPGVKLHVTDGRNLLLLSPQAKYDVVSIEITSIWFAGAASLYNKEFYRLAKSRMNPQGVLQQWMQLHRLTPIDLMQVMATLRSEFKYVSLYVMGSQGILVATDDATRAAPVAEAMSKLEATPALAEVRRIAARTVLSMKDDVMLDAAGVDRFIKGLGVDGSIWLSTDDNLALEYSTPRANVNDAEQSFALNKSLLAKYR